VIATTSAVDDGRTANRTTAHHYVSRVQNAKGAPDDVGSLVPAPSFDSREMGDEALDSGVDLCSCVQLQPQLHTHNQFPGPDVPPSCLKTAGHRHMTNAWSPSLDQGTV
jgi:hypothetical protein